MSHRDPPGVVRVFLVLPPMARDIVIKLLESEPDITVLGAVGDTSDLEAAIGTARSADVVLVSGDAAAAATAFELLGLPNLPAVMAIDANGTNVELQEVSPRTRTLGDLSPAEFVEAIRTVTKREAVTSP